MRSLVAVGLTVAMAAHGGVLRADPSTPQIDPRHGRREDARRLRELWRSLDRETRRAPVVDSPPPPPVRTPGEPSGSRLVTAGVVMLVLAGVCGVATAGTADSADTDARNVLLVTTVVSGLAGVTLVLAGRAVHVAPTVTSRTVGLTVARRF